MKSMACAVGLMLLLYAVPLQAQTLPDIQKTDIEKAVKNQITQWYAALDTLNAEASMQFWSRNQVIGSLSPTGTNSDLEVMLKNIKNGFASRKLQKSEIADIKVLVLSAEMAVAFTKGTNRIEMRNGNISLNNWASTTILVKESGEWKIAHNAGTAATRQ